MGVKSNNFFLTLSQPGRLYQSKGGLEEKNENNKQNEKTNVASETNIQMQCVVSNQSHCTTTTATLLWAQKPIIQLHHQHHATNIIIHNLTV